MFPSSESLLSPGGAAGVGAAGAAAAGAAAAGDAPAMVTPSPLPGKLQERKVIRLNGVHKGEGAARSMKQAQPWE